MLDTLRAMIKDDRFGSGHTRTKLLAAIDKILAAGRAAGDVGTQPTSEDVAAGLIGMFSVAPTAGNSEQSARLLDIFMSGPLGTQPRRVDDSTRFDTPHREEYGGVEYGLDRKSVV